MVQKFTDAAPSGEPLNWDDVRYFLEVARQGKLTAAARVLQVEHSTVSRRVGALEHQLGLRLFDRLPRSWNLTSEGEQLLAYARRIEDEALALGRAAMGAGTLRGTVRISAPPVVASHFIVPRLGALRRRWPGIALELIGEARHANLFRREADLALRLSRPEEPGLAARSLAQIEYGLYAAPAWLERPAGEWEFIGYEDKLAGTRPFALRSNDLAALHQACRAGLGLALLPHFLARDDASLAVVDGHAAVLSRPIWLAIHPDVRRSPRVKAVAEALTELFAQHAPALARGPARSR
jgi:DNA-binding transcriptional LysR family regulator